MFKQQKERLFDNQVKNTSVENPFLVQGLKKSARTLSGNGAEKFSTTGNAFVDQFANLGSYKAQRPYDKIEQDANLLFSLNSEKAIKFNLYMRLITRKIDFIDGSSTETVQRGAGLKYEAIMRFIWLGVNHPKLFAANLPLFVAVGSWKDLFEMLRTDLIYHGWDDRVLNWDVIWNTIAIGLANSNDLVKKYLPQLKAKSKCTSLKAQANTMIAKWIANKLDLDYKGYRKFKSSGTAHTWQQLISQKAMNEIDFNSIHGRALMLLTNSKFIEKNRLQEKYEAWIESQPIAKFTGWPHELMAKIPGRWDSKQLKPYQKTTINKQFMGLVETGMKNAETNTSMIVVRDTSGSMSSNADGINMSAGDIAKSLALYFSYFLTGAFANSWIEFNSKAKMKQWQGDNPVDRFVNDNSSYIGGTNFMDVINLFGELKFMGVPELEFPTGIICISDGEFNRTGRNTNFEAAKQALIAFGFSKEYVENFTIVMWDLRNSYYGRRGAKFETYGETENVFYFSGYDASVMAFLTGRQTANNENVQIPKTDVELFEAAMEQEVLQLVKSS